jgi:hypothetical protein
VFVLCFLPDPYNRAYLFFSLAVVLVDAAPAPALIGDGVLSLPSAGEAKEDVGGEEVETGEAAILVMAASCSMLDE